VELPKGRSGLENETIAWLYENNIEFDYERSSFSYKVPEVCATYTPDFFIGDSIIELKGRLTARDRKKILHVLASVRGLAARFIIVFPKPNNRIAKGSRTTYAEWCEKNGIRWYSLQDFKQRLLKGKL